MLVFQKIWRALFSCNTRFEIRPFDLLPTFCSFPTRYPLIFFINYTSLVGCSINFLLFEISIALSSDVTDRSVVDWIFLLFVLTHLFPQLRLNGGFQYHNSPLR